MKQQHFPHGRDFAFGRLGSARTAERVRVICKIDSELSEVGFLNLFYNFRGSASQQDCGSRKRGALLKAKETD
jgi:hypothetical protein